MCYVFRPIEGSAIQVDEVIRRLERELWKRELALFVMTELSDGVWPSSASVNETDLCPMGHKTNGPESDQ